MCMRAYNYDRLQRHGGNSGGGDSKIERAVCISFQSQTQLNTFGAEFAHSPTSELLFSVQ